MTLQIPGQLMSPVLVASHFHLKEGDKVADFGAGSGFFIKPLSEAVGSLGRVYACDIQKGLVEKIGDYARLTGLGNVHPLWCDLEEVNGIKLPNLALDAGVLSNTLFQFEDKVTAITEIHRVLRPGGLVFVIDWTESFGGLGPRTTDVVDKDAATALFETQHFILEREFPAGDHHYGLAFRKI